MLRWPVHGDEKMRNRWRYLVLALLTVLLLTIARPVWSQPSAHVLGQQAYDRGQLAAAVTHWQTAMREFESVGDVRSQSLTAGHLALAYQDLGEWATAATWLEQAQQLANAQDDAFVMAQLLMVQGTQAWYQGQGTEALARWQQAEQQYQSLGDDTGLLQSQINQVQALQLLGKHQQAFQQLQQLLESLQALPANSLKVMGLHTLGTTLHGIGEWEQAAETLAQGLALAKQLQLPLASKLHLSLGNVLRAQGKLAEARVQYQQSSELTIDRSLWLTAQLNQLKVLIDQEQVADAIAILPNIQNQLSRLPPSREQVYAQVNLGNSLIRLAQMANVPPGTLDRRAIAETLATAVNQARSLDDPKAEAYALGELGHLYEISQQWSAALELTQTAAQLAQALQAREIAMPWQWQAGRILKQLGETEGAIAAYAEAVDSLKALRQDLVALSPDVQFSFREQVEPVYRQFTQLLLTDVDRLPEARRQAQLLQARQLIEDLQLATLDNFFRQACIAGSPRRIDQIDRAAAVIYPILLDQASGEQRLEVIVSVAETGTETGELLHYRRRIAPGESQQLWETLQARLTLLYDVDEILPAAQTLYEWLVAPAEPLLARHHIQTLVFVPDRFLRNVPMAVLYDGQQFLMEKYTLALAPGLQLLPSAQAEPLDITNRPQILASGLSEQRDGFIALPNVKKELAQLEQLAPTETFLNQAFVTANLQAQLEENAFPIIHLATHGQFSSNLDDTFLLTWDQRLSIQDLEILLARQDYRQPIELLILSACQTARGDNRAALGLAGIAVRAGARSIVSTLWSVADDSTARLVTEFYQNLTQQTTKAEALRQAQLSLLQSTDYHHPYFWAPFVLVGNWQ